MPEAQDGVHEAVECAEPHGVCRRKTASDKQGHPAIDE
jgi:hypothetical protein